MEWLENAVKNTGSSTYLNYEKKEWTVAWTQSQRTEVEMWNRIIKDFYTLYLFGNWKIKFDSWSTSTFSLQKAKIAMPAVNLSHRTKLVFLNLQKAWLGSAVAPVSQKRWKKRTVWEDGTSGSWAHITLLGCILSCQPQQSDNLHSVSARYWSKRQIVQFPSQQKFQANKSDLWTSQVFPRIPHPGRSWKLSWNLASRWIPLKDWHWLSVTWITFPAKVINCSLHRGCTSLVNESHPCSHLSCSNSAEKKHFSCWIPSSFFHC